LFSSLFLFPRRPQSNTHPFLIKLTTGNARREPLNVAIQPVAGGGSRCGGRPVRYGNMISYSFLLGFGVLWCFTLLFSYFTILFFFAPFLLLCRLADSRFSPLSRKQPISNHRLIISFMHSAHPIAIDLLSFHCFVVTVSVTSPRL